MGKRLEARKRWDPRKIGAKPDPELRAMRLQVTESIANAIGVPIGLTTGHEEGTALREDFRRLVHTCIQPLGKLFKYELERVIEEEVMLDYSALNAADITSRARAYQSLTDKKNGRRERRPAYGDGPERDDLPRSFYERE